jgi:hypothetical protein
MSKKIKILDKEENEVEFEDILQAIVRKISDKDFMETSKGKLAVSELLETLMEKDDPFIRAISIIGSEQAVNSVGILLFVAFQLGYTFASNGYSPEYVTKIEEEVEDSE